MDTKTQYFEILTEISGLERKMNKLFKTTGASDEYSALKAQWQAARVKRDDLQNYRDWHPTTCN